LAESPWKPSAHETQALEDLAIEMLARGLSVQDIEDAFKDESGRLLLSRTAVSELGARLWDDYQAFAKRDLSEYELAYLFVDGIAERLRPGAKREPVLAAWGYTVDGRRVLLWIRKLPAAGDCSTPLITNWLEVRVLPAPPRSPALTPSSPFPRHTLDFPRLGRA